MSKLAIVVGGGPAPGINGVISAVTLAGDQSRHPGVRHDGRLQAPVDGKTDMIRQLAKNDVRYMDLRGGSMLRTSRTNPTKSKADMDNVLRGLPRVGNRRPGQHRRRRHRLFRQPGLSRQRRQNPRRPRPQDHRQRFAPARLDADLRLRNRPPARHATSSATWPRTPAPPRAGISIVSMGRAAGHLALGIGKASAATLTIIPEEFRGRDRHDRRVVRHRHRLHHQAARRTAYATASSCSPRA